MDSTWLKTQLRLNPQKSKADLARALDLPPSAISKMLADGRQIKAQEYVSMRKFFGLADNGPGRPVIGGANYVLRPLEDIGDGRTKRHKPVKEDPWIIPARLLKGRTKAEAENIRIFSVRDNSMSPHFTTGEHVLVDLSDKKPSPPGFFVVSDGLNPIIRQCDIVPQSRPASVRLSGGAGAPFIMPLKKADITGRVIAKLLWLT